MNKYLEQRVIFFITWRSFIIYLFHSFISILPPYSMSRLAQFSQNLILNMQTVCMYCWQIALLYSHPSRHHQHWCTIFVRAFIIIGYIRTYVHMEWRKEFTLKNYKKWNEHKMSSQVIDKSAFFLKSFLTLKKFKQYFWIIEKTKCSEGNYAKNYKNLVKTFEF